jgi:hypothetical protein
LEAALPGLLLSGVTKRRPPPVASEILLGLGLDQVPPQVLEEILEKYPRMSFKAEFKNLLVEHCLHNPAAQVLNWTDDIARTAGCTLRGQPIPTATQIMSAAPFDE